MIISSETTVVKPTENGEHTLILKVTSDNKPEIDRLHMKILDLISTEGKRISGGTSL